MNDTGVSAFVRGLLVWIGLSAPIAIAVGRIIAGPVIHVRPPLHRSAD